MEFLYSLFGTPLGYIMWVCYLLTQDIGIAIIIFTVIVKAASFPLSLKQQKNAAMSQLFMPRVKEIQTKYRNNQQKMAEETSKLQKEGYNPAGGCLPMIITLVILFGVLDVVYKPMTYFERFEQTEEGSISYIKEIASTYEKAEALLGVSVSESEQSEQNESEEPVSTVTIEFIENKTSKSLSEITAGDIVVLLNADNAEEELPDTVSSQFKTIDTQYKSLQGEIRAIGVYRKNPEAFSSITNSEIRAKLSVLEERIVFLGIDFSERPSLVFAPIILIPILSFLFSVTQTVIMQIIQRKSTVLDMNQQMGAMKYMLYIMPLFSLYIVFQFPAGVGFYWTVSSILGIAQSILIYKVWSPEKLKAEAVAILEKRNSGFNADNVVVIEKDGKDGSVEKTAKKMSDMSSSERKEYYRKKLEEARKEDLEKYGEVGSAPPEDSNQ